jgi:hypothetical protein
VLVLCAWLTLAAADPVIDQGEKFYSEGNYMGAIRLLERVLASGTAARTQARLYLAASHFAAGDRDAAQRVLAALFAEDPNAKIDADKFPPPFVKVFEDARPKAKPAEAPPNPNHVPANVEPPPPAPPPPDQLHEPTPAPAPPRRTSALGFIPLVAGVAAGGVGTYFLIHAQSVHATLTTPPKGASDVLTYPQGKMLSSDGSLSQTVGWVLIGVAAAALLTAAVMFLFVHSGSAP